MKESEARQSVPHDDIRVSPPEEAARAALPNGFRLGHEAKFLLVAVGGGAMRVVRSAALPGIRYVETVAINGDDRVIEALDFHQRIRVDLPRDGWIDGGEHPLSQPIPHLMTELDRVFEGSTFVTVVASLGGGSGTEVLPSVLDAAARHAPFLSVFLLKPFACEEERRAVAEHALEALRAQGTFAERVRSHQATLSVLDNETAVRTQGHSPFNRLDRLWGDVVASHILDRYVGPAEAALEEYRMARQSLTPLNAVPNGSAPFDVPPIPTGPAPMPEAIVPQPALVHATVPPTSPAHEVEILLEVSGDIPHPPRPPTA
jgi:hypothetical protein